MNRLLLTVEYDGTDFVGWQRQPANHGVSVQQALEKALSAVCGSKIAVQGAGRTDSGVHALGQCCHFDAPEGLPVEKLPLIVNRLLPAGISIRSAEKRAADFHARFDATRKHYRYIIEQDAPASAFCGRFTWQSEGMLDVAAMQAAAPALVGEHDFRNYTVSGVSATQFVRNIYRLSVTAPEPKEADFPWQRLHAPVVIDVEGNGFLYKMVRIISGRLAAIGRGELPVTALAGYLDGSVTENIPPAPARGLTLMQVFYD